MLQLSIFDGEPEEGSPKLYSIGYNGRNPEEMIRGLSELGVVTLVDVRYKPWTRVRGFKKWELARRLGVGAELSYEHVEEFGNINYRSEIDPSGNAILLDEAVGVEKVTELLSRGPVAVMCVCSKVTRCHRSLVCDVMKSSVEGLVVIHI